MNRAEYETTFEPDIEEVHPMKHYLLSLYQPDGDPPASVDLDEIRRKLETELFHDRYRLVSKNDDDLPIVR